MKDLTPRLTDILRTVVEYHIATGRPVGSKCLCESGDFGLAASTVRSELARLEDMGYLSHPYTSAGRVPTDRGYRFFVDDYFKRHRHHYHDGAVTSGELGEGIEDALKYSARLLAGSTGLLALVSAPSQNNAAIKHVEVLRLQPDMILVVIITASGGISKKVVLFGSPVDRGLVDWARGYLNEAVCDLDLGSRLLRLRLAGADLPKIEASFISSLAAAFFDLPDGGAGDLYVDGVSKFFTRLEEDGSASVHYLMGLMDQQGDILKLLGSAIKEQRVYLRIGREMPDEAMRECSLVAANYGIARRNLGTVGVLGPTRMDYGAVIGSVEQAARSLSRFVEERF